jgi:hypothetical protein
MTDVKKQRTPRSYDDIARGASKLTLEEKAQLRDQLIKEISEEAAKLQQAAENAAKLVKA